MSEVNVPFTIRSPSVPGGFLQFTTSSMGENATFGSGGSSASQWSMQPAGDGVSVLITNQQSGNPIAGGPPDWKLKSGSGHPWYLYPVGGSYYAICYDPSCMMVWAPLSLVGNGVPGSNEVVVANAGGLQYEWWEVLQTGSQPPSPPPADPPVVSTTNNGQASSAPVYPRPSSTALPAAPGNVQALAECKPCGTTDCSFEPSGPPTPATYTVLIGQPVANCNPGSQKDVTTKFGGKYELSTSFSVEATAGVNGLGVFGPSFSTTIAKSEGTKTEQAQEVEIQIEPGKVGALLAEISYSKIPGKMDVGKSSLAFVAVQPGLVLRYTVNYTDCGTDFQALSLPKECSQGSTAISTRMSIVDKGALFGLVWLFTFILSLS